MDYKQKCEAQKQTISNLSLENECLLNEIRDLKEQLTPSDEVHELIKSLYQLQDLWNEKLIELHDIQNEYNNLISEMRQVRDDARSARRAHSLFRKNT